MPITVQVTEGLLDAEGKKKLFNGITTSILKVNRVPDNDFALRHLIGNIITVPADSSFAGGKNEPFVNVGLAVPVYSMTEPAQRQQFTSEITDLVMELTGLVRDRVYINMLYGDGFWGVGGIAFPNDVLKETVMNHQPS